MQTLWQDVRYAIRMMLKKPGFTVAAVVVIAIGIGANSAIFSVVNYVLLNPLPFKDPDRIVALWTNLNQENLEKLETSVPEFIDLAEQATSFEHIAAHTWNGFNLTGGDQPERILGAAVSASLFPLLGIEAEHGRTFTADEDQAGSGQVVVISHGLWQRRFGADLSAVGKTIHIDARPFTIIGVMPAEFRFPVTNIDLWKPIAFTAEEKSENERGSHYLNVIAKLKSGVTLEQAQGEMNRIASRIAEQHASSYTNGFGLSLFSLHEEIVRKIKPALLMLLAAVGFVLLISCANVANLLLARASARQREIAIRCALGASRWRIVRHLLTESMLLALVGGTLGLLLALWGVDLLVSLGPAGIPGLQNIAIDGRALGFTILLTGITGVMFGLAPALQVSKPDLNESLKEGGRSATEGGGGARLRNLLVVAEVALAMVLLVGAGLMIKSFIRLTQVNPGFNPDNVLSMRVVLSQERYPEPQMKRAFFNQLLERVESLPGVESVGAVTALPLSEISNNRNFTIEGNSQEANPTSDYVVISPNYFSVMGIQVLRGRHFTAADNREPATVIINESFARRYWPAEDAVGRRIKLGGSQSPFPWMSIVGVVGDVKHQGLDADVKPEMYVPYGQTKLPGFPVGAMFLVVRGRGNTADTVAAVRGEVLTMDKEQPVANIQTMEQRLSQSIAQRRFNMALLAIFAGVALLLASVGIYGVMSYSVARRTHEIGIRMALGAEARDIFKLVIGKGMALALSGVAIGLVAALALTRLMEGLLFGVAATDTLTFAAVSLILTGVALAACFVPARRATKVDPMVALRYE